MAKRQQFGLRELCGRSLDMLAVQAESVLIGVPTYKAPDSTGTWRENAVGHGPEAGSPCTTVSKAFRISKFSLIFLRKGCLLR